MNFFSFQQNRSERAKQVQLLVPALANPKTRQILLQRHKIDKPESDQAEVFHFVWILRDHFTYERDLKVKESPTGWPEFFQKWTGILALPPGVANEHPWWMDHQGKDQQPRIIHPCSQKLGWTDTGLEGKGDTKVHPLLQDARKVMNTECDCFIQTPQRLIVIECKDKTGFTSEQLRRQKLLRQALHRLFDRPTAPLALFIANRVPDEKYPGWSWSEIQNVLKI